MGEDLPDATLVVGTLSGDGEAFAALYRRHAGAVQRVVAGTVRDRETVADLVQDVFARAIEALPSLREQDHFRAWVLAIAHHAAIDHGRTQRPSTPLGVDEEAEPTASDPEPHELAEMGAVAQRVRGCVAGLSARDATVLALVSQLGYSPAEVANALGISSGAAKVVVHRARRRLRYALALTLLAELQDEACPAFRTAYEAGRLTAAGTHVESCPTCRDAVNAEVHLFQGAGSRPTTRIPARSKESARTSGNGRRSAMPKAETSRAP